MAYKVINIGFNSDSELILSDNVKQDFIHLLNKNFDVEGLQALGWDAMDILWLAEQANNNLAIKKAISGITATSTNFAEKEDTSEQTDIGSKYRNKQSLITIPYLNTSNVTNMEGMFANCPNLITFPLLDTSKVNRMDYMFESCSTLTTIPYLNTGKVNRMEYMFDSCSNLITIPLLDTGSVTNMESMFVFCSNLTTIPYLNTNNVTIMDSMFAVCSNLISISLLDVSKVNRIDYMFYGCTSLTTVKLKNLKINISFNDSPNISKESLVYILTNRANTSAITITLHSDAYARLSTDADVIALLSATATQGSVTLASA